MSKGKMVTPKSRTLHCLQESQRYVDDSAHGNCQHGLHMGPVKQWID